jgi:hypothetical protein
MQYLTHVAAAVAMLLLTLAGCANDSYRYVAEVGQRGTVHVVEHGQRRQFERAVVRFTSGMGYVKDYLSASVPARDDEAAVRTLIRDTPLERRPTNLMRVSAPGYHAANYPWYGRLHWIIASDPLVNAIGGEQGRGTADRARQRGSEYPLVGTSDLGEQVTHIIIQGRLPELLRAGDKHERKSDRQEVITLPRPMSLDEVLTALANGNLPSSDQANVLHNPPMQRTATASSGAIE